ncbi:MAG: extracellular solute-binding protein, partial [Hoeflea sp.]|nr:extracellular solute-binding protein [Hoeflea sp.]
MTKSIRGLALSALLGTTMFAGAAYADCGISAGKVSIIGNDFPAIHTVVNAAAGCATGAVEVKSNLTADHQKLNAPGMTANPAEYTSAVVASSSIVPLMSAGLIRPLDELIAAHGADIPKSQLITIDGKVMAVAFMANAQHLFYRKDLLEAAGVAAPATYDELLAAAEKIRAGGMATPFCSTYKAGWNLGEEFVNTYLGLGGDFFKPGTAEPAINNENGVAALELMKALTGYMSPDYLTFDSNIATAEYEAGNCALMTLWGSRAGALMDGKDSAPGVAENTVAAAAPSAGGNSFPATTLWWDGWTVATNISDEDAVATFLAMKAGTAPSILTADTMGQAVWLLDGYTPSPEAQGISASIAGGARPYPMEPYMGAMHTALGDNIADFLAGKEDAAQALA